MKTVSFRLPENMIEALDVLNKKEAISKGSFIRLAIKSRLESIGIVLPVEEDEEELEDVSA